MSQNEDQSALGTDDMSVLRQLLHSMQGVSPVSADPLALPAEGSE
jgi:hypothetical protein